MKVAFGDDGTSRDASAAFPLPSAAPNVYANGTITAANANLTSGAATAGSAVQVTGADHHAAWDVYFSGTWSAGTTLHFQGSMDGNAWWALNGRKTGDAAANSSGTVLDTDPTGSGNNPSNWRGNLAGIRYFRVTCGPFTTGDSINVMIGTSAGAGATFLNAALPPGTSMIGSVKMAPSSATAITSVALGTASFAVLAANVNRLGATVYNESGNVVYLALAATATTTAYTVQIPANGYYELPNASLTYVGAISAIATVASGNLRITELS